MANKNFFFFHQILHFVYPCISIWLILDIIFFSVIPGHSLQDLSWLSLFNADKIGHLIFYFSASLFLILSGLHPKITIVSMIGLGLSLEVIQWSMHNGRSFDIYDIVADIIGTCAISLKFHKLNLFRFFEIRK